MKPRKPAKSAGKSNPSETSNRSKPAPKPNHPEIPDGPKPAPRQPAWELREPDRGPRERTGTPAKPSSPALDSRAPYKSPVGGEVQENRGVPGATRARARELDKLVAGISDAMIANRWGPAQAAELAQREGVSPSTVDNWAGEAARLLRLAPDIDHRRGLHLARLDRAWTMATELADPKAAVSAVAEANKVLGLHAPVKADVSVTVQTFAALDDEAMLAKVEEQIAALTELRATLLAKRSVPVLPAKE